MNITVASKAITKSKQWLKLDLITINKITI